jgi:hypothetical protein
MNDGRYRLINGTIADIEEKINALATEGFKPVQLMFANLQMGIIVLLERST